MNQLGVNTLAQSGQMSSTSTLPVSGRSVGNSDKFAPNRKYIGLVLVSATLIFVIIGDIAMAVTYDVGFETSDAACVIQSSFGIFLTCTFLEVFCLLVQIFGIFCKIESWKRQDFYRVNILCHLMSSIGFLVALTIFGAKLNNRIKWFFWFELIGTLICVANLLLWFVTQMMRRFMRRRHPM